MKQLKETIEQKNKILSDLNNHDEVNSIIWRPKMERDKMRNVFILSWLRKLNVDLKLLNELPQWNQAKVYLLS